MKIIDILEVDLGVKVTLGKTLLFLDEIQSAPELIALVRYFYENMNVLHVIAAGSLLVLYLMSTTSLCLWGVLDICLLGRWVFMNF